MPPVFWRISVPIFRTGFLKSLRARLRSGPRAASKDFRVVVGVGSKILNRPSKRHGTSSERDPFRGLCRAGSLTGAVHLSKGNAGVLRRARRGRKPRVEQKGKCWLDPDFQYEYGPRKRGLSILSTSNDREFRARGVRKVTTGITGLWRPSVHSDVAF